MSASSSLSSEPEISLGKPYKETYESVEKHPGSEHSSITVEPRMKTTHRKPAKKGSISANRPINKLIKAETSSNNLTRAPSLPSHLAAESEEVQDEETEFSMSKLIRQASLNSSTIALAKTKVGTPSTILLEEDKDQTSRRKLEQEKIKADESQKINTIPKPQVLRSKLRTQKSLNDLKLEELKSVKDMAAKKSKDDIKVQIKFWAKAVASNVRQEGS